MLFVMTYFFFLLQTYLRTTEISQHPNNIALMLPSWGLLGVW